MSRGRWLLPACLGAALAFAAPARAAVTIGPKTLPERSAVISAAGATIFTNDAVPGATLASPIDGVVVRWRVRRGSGPGSLFPDTITLRILRPTGVAGQFTAVGTSAPHAVPGGEDPIDVYEFPTQLPIKAGDRIGLGSSVGSFASDKAAGASYLYEENPLADGETGLFKGPEPEYFVPVNADVEPDCDHDGLGDETQDPEIPHIPSCGFPEAPKDTTAPQTRIVKGPKKRIRTRKQRLTAKFSFSSDDPAARFECKLDKGAFRPCSSPKRYRIKATAKFRKHTFSVRAVDPAGNVDATPAMRRFEIERKG